MLPVCLALFVARTAGIVVGSYLGANLGSLPPKHVSLAWQAFMTQAGVALGLAEQISRQYPWGHDFQTAVLATVVLNQFCGPPLFKHAIQAAGEARDKLFKGPVQNYQQNRGVLVFGNTEEVDDVCYALSNEGWEVLRCDLASLIRVKPLKELIHEKTLAEGTTDVESAGGAPADRTAGFSISSNTNFGFVPLDEDEDAISSKQRIDIDDNKVKDVIKSMTSLDYMLVFLESDSLNYQLVRCIYNKLPRYKRPQPVVQVMADVGVKHEFMKLSPPPIEMVPSPQVAALLNRILIPSKRTVGSLIHFAQRQLHIIRGNKDGRLSLSRRGTI